MESPSPVSPKSFPVPKQRAGTEQQQKKNNNNNNNDNNNNEGGETMVKKMPIAIVPGWQVTWSDWFASRVEIKDAYSPMDHWQWGATLWRNMVGADVTVAVQAAAAAQDTSSSSSLVSPDKASLKTGGGSEAKGGHEKGRNGGSGGGSAVGGVEVKLEDARAVIVRGERDGGVAEGGLRRVGFEIGEWVRGWEEKEERARRGS